MRLLIIISLFISSMPSININGAYITGFDILDRTPVIVRTYEDRLKSHNLTDTENYGGSRFITGILIDIPNKPILVPVMK